jgi:hypothetical protein
MKNPMTLHDFPAISWLNLHFSGKMAQTPKPDDSSGFTLVNQLGDGHQ